jgi:ubiquitin-like 1-activating enzyme E1 B
VSSHSQYDQDANAADGGRLPEQMVWSVPQCVMKFFEAMELLQARRKDSPLTFSKDDEDTLTFVTAASNLRSHIFGIPMQSRFDVKASAGNIIAAIATTNAIIAGLIVLQALKVVAGNPLDARCVYLNRKPSRNRLLVSSNLDIPSENCFVCGANYVTLSLDTKRWTLGSLIEKVLRQQLGFHEPNVDTGVTYIEGGNEGLEPAEIAARDKQLVRPLHEVGIASGKMLTVSDQSQNLTVTIAVRQKDDAPGADPAFEVTGKAKAAKEDPATAAAAAVAPPPAPNDARAPLVIEDDDLVLTVLPRTPTAAATSAKRSVAEVPEEAAEEGGSQAAKKIRR